MLRNRTCILWTCLLIIFSGLLLGASSSEDSDVDEVPVEATVPPSQNEDELPLAEQQVSDAPTETEDEGDEAGSDAAEGDDEAETGSEGDNAGSNEGDDEEEEMPTNPPATAAVDVTEEPDTDFKITTSDGSLCIRAHFSLSFRIKYAGMVKDKLRVRETDMDMPTEGLTVTGSCEDEPRALTISWNNGNYSVTFEFSHQVRADSDIAREGIATSAIKFTLNSRDPNYFNKPLNPGTYTTSTAPSRNHFWVPNNTSFLCDTRQRVILLEYDARGDVIEENVVKVLMWISNAQLEAFDIGDDGEFRDPTVCEADIYSKMPKTNIIPIVVAACLACLIIFIVIVYFISKNVGMNSYRSME